jgi:chromosome segregation ATPase
MLTGTYDENGAPKIFKPVKEMIKFEDPREIDVNRELYGKETVHLNSDIDSYCDKVIPDISGEMCTFDTCMKDTHYLEDRRSITGDKTVLLSRQLLHERNSVERGSDNISAMKAARAKGKKSIETIVGEINEVKASLKLVDAGLKCGNYDENTVNEQKETKSKLTKRMASLRSELKSDQSEYDKLGKAIEVELQGIFKSAEKRVNYQKEINELLTQDAETETLRLEKFVLPPLYAEIEKQKGILEDTKIKIGQLSFIINNEERLIDHNQEEIKQITVMLNNPAISEKEKDSLTDKKRILRHEIRETRKSIKSAKQNLSEIGSAVKEITALLKSYNERKQEAEIRIIRMKRISESAARERKALESFAITRFGY